ncbi:hypothetical protein [Capnocytophaga gingivalis]|uniref:hypothetical protein n=1 Tax=Capnocytophaga gingivalis TaxID=1017 RepID=UPI0028E26473|nr:hypothetical protein [Capnocytophaga gingivalis]
MKNGGSEERRMKNEECSQRVPTANFTLLFSLFTTYPSSFAWLHFSLFTFHHIPKLIRLATLFTFHFSLFTLHSSLFTLHSSLFTLHSSLYSKMLYPHYLFLLTPSLSQQRADGTWTASTLSRSFACRCLQEANSKGQEVPLANSLYHHVQTANASFRRFAYVVYLPRDAPHIPEGSLILIANDPEGNDPRSCSIVQKYDQGQLHNRIFL